MVKDEQTGKTYMLLRDVTKTPSDKYPIRNEDERKKQQKYENWEYIDFCYTRRLGEQLGWNVTRTANKSERWDCNITDFNGDLQTTYLGEIKAREVCISDFPNCKVDKYKVDELIKNETETKRGLVIALYKPNNKVVVWTAQTAAKSPVHDEKARSESFIGNDEKVDKTYYLIPIKEALASYDLDLSQFDNNFQYFNKLMNC